MIYLLAHKLSNGKQALAVGKDDNLVGTEDLEEAKKLIPNWNGYHVVDNTWSASATLYWMSYHPHIVSFNNIEEVAAVLQKGENVITRESNVWGSARYTIIGDHVKLNVVFDPRLIDEGVNTAKPFYER